MFRYLLSVLFVVFLFVVSQGPVYAQAAGAEAPSPSSKQPANPSGKTEPLLAAGNAAVGESAPAPTEAKIQPGDTLAVNVYNEDDISRDFDVSQSGFITYPLLGKVKVEGLTKEEAERLVRDLLVKDYLVNPIVSVRVSRPATPKAAAAKRQALTGREEEVPLVSYVILGEVKKPGTYEYDPTKGSMTLLKAVSIAGGFTPIANMGKIKVLRREGETVRSFTLSARDIINGRRSDEEIRPEDVIMVPESLF